MTEQQRPFSWFSWGFFLAIKCFSPSEGEDWLHLRAASVFHSSYTGCSSWWLWLRILQVSVKLFTGCTWAIKLCQLVSYLKAAALAGHQQMAFWSKTHLAFSPEFSRVCCVHSLHSWWRESGIYRRCFSHLGLKIWRQVSFSSEVSVSINWNIWVLLARLWQVKTGCSCSLLLRFP